MIRNYFIIAWRNLKNNLMFSVLNIIGLSIGMAACLVMWLFSLDQYSYDKHHEHADRIYRVVNKQLDGTKLSFVSVTQGVLAGELLKTFPEVEAATRVGFTTASLIINDQEPTEEKIMAVDPAYFSIFTTPFKYKPVGEVISSEGILLSEEAAARLFKGKNPMGEVVSLDNKIHLKVTGVFKEFPVQTHLYTDMIISFSWIEKTEPHANIWSSNSYYNYVLMPEEFDREAFSKKMDAHIHKFTPAAWTKIEYFLQPLRVISLEPGYVANPKGSIGSITINGFMMVSLIILLLASFNYMNMATARSIKRSREVGIRKVVGAHRGQLIGQFLMEAFILCCVGFLIGILLADFGVQFFNFYTGFHLKLSTFFTDPILLGWLIISLLVLTILSGGYPAFFLSRFIPATVLKGQRLFDSSRRFRQGLVLFQFSLTSLLIIMVIVVLKQTNFMRTYDLGFNKEQLLIFSADRNKGVGADSFKSELMKIQGVTQVCNASSLPSFRIASATNIWVTGKPQEESIKSLWLYTDHDYIPILQLKIVAGRNFNSNGNDQDKGVIINENAAAALGWTPEESIGKRISGFAFTDSLPGEIVGVIKDFHISPLRKAIMPLIIGYNMDQIGFMVKLNSPNLHETRQLVDKIAVRFTHGNFESSFMEDTLEESYGAEIVTGEMLTFFTILAVLIGCSGLYALSVYEGEQRMKELGIRKIMGATTQQLLILVSVKFIKLIAWSLVVAMPLAYFLSNFWLTKYPYRIPWSADIFVLSAVLVLVLGWLTIFVQAMKVARLNPVDTLRYE
ncbi:MAG TPA: ABC transporter permease [Cyclobacteriaceae bacterium]|nr:ABC transporter permease [Cyclobacteriaceae bacterium]